MNEHRQTIESAWGSLLEAVTVAAQESRASHPGGPTLNKEIAPKLDTLLAALTGLSNAWTGIRDLFPAEHIEETDKSDVPGALPESAYWKPLAKALLAHGGESRAREAIATVGKLMDESFRQMDRDPVSSGQVRWIVRTRFARNTFREHGLISTATPPGIWKLTDAGIRWGKSNIKDLPQPIPEPDPRQPTLFPF